MLYLLILMAISLPFAIPIGIIAIVVHFLNKKDKNNNAGQYGNPQMMPNMPQQNQYYQGTNPMMGNLSDPSGFTQAPVSGETLTQQTSVQQPFVQQPFVQQPVMPNPPRMNIPVKPPKPAREPLSSSAVMLLIGTALVVLSGIAFGAANWLNTSPFGRVLTILIASVVSFIISTIFYKAVKLKGTSSAFYMVGSLFIPVALLIMGFYNMLGNWFSIDGGGRFLLAAASFAITAIACFAGNKIYKAKHFVYSGLSMSSASLLFVALQTSTINNEASMAVFTSILITLQVLITAAIYGFGIHEKTEYAAPVKVIGTITSMLYGFISLGYVFSTAEEPTLATYFILAAITAQLIAYGIGKKQKWMLGVQSITSVMLVHIFCADIGSTLPGGYDSLIFGLLITGLYFANRFVPQLRTAFSEAIMIFFMLGASMMTLDDMRYLHAAAIIVPFITSAVIYSYIFSKSNAVQFVSGVLSPLVPLMITISSAKYFNILFAKGKMESNSIVEIIYFIAVIALVAISAAIFFLPKYAFEFHAKHPRSSDAVLYSGMFVAFIILVAANSDFDYLILPLLASAAHFAVANSFKNNILAVGSGIAFNLTASHLICDVFGDYPNVYLIFCFALLLVMMAISKAAFPKAVISRKDGRTLFDSALLSGLVIIPCMSDMGSASDFFMFLSAAVALACFIKSKTKEDTAAVILSISAILTAIALFNRPFLVPENEMISNKITFAIIAAVGFAFKYIWRKHEKGSYIASNIIFVLTFAALILDALYFENAGNTVFVLAVTTLILIAAFMTKSKTWFSASSIAIASIILYAAHGFLSSLSGWVYLFAAGLILIGIAAVNEYYKQKGENVKSRLANVFSDWKW